jgi:hypothetical protein
MSAALRLSLTDLEGTWHILASNFPMWKNGSRKEPTFNYTLFRRDGKDFLLDEVKFMKNGKANTIAGYDSATNTANTAFTWKGKGILFFFKSHWEISWMNERKDMAVIRFTKTLFTPAGFDIIAREKEAPGITDAISQLGKDEQESLFYIKHI